MNLEGIVLHCREERMSGRFVQWAMGLWEAWMVPSGGDRPGVSARHKWRRKKGVVRELL